jgi:hypothetical protein
MPPKNEDEAELKKRYEAYVKANGYEKLTPPRKGLNDLNDLMRQLAAEGDELLAKENKTTKPTPPKDETKKLDKKLASISPNPWVRARTKILNDYPEWRRKEIENMENGKYPKDYHYDDFVHEVRILGDEYEEKDQAKNKQK